MAPPEYCPVPLETPTVNGCPMCPRCPCTCGETCQMSGGASGICMENGECSTNKRKPQCPNSCALILCGPNTRCENGKCVPILTGCETVRCTAETICVNGRCVPRPDASCALVLCGPDTRCEKGKCVPILTGCETVRCNAETVCVNGRCVPRPGSEKCKCGETCTMYGGSQGVCQVNGECAQNIQPPQCPSNKCKCGDTCTMPYGGSGVCQVDGKCAVNIQKPDCPYDGDLTMCPMDVQACPDGSFVSRKPPSCAFEACPVRGCTRDVRQCPDGSTVGREGPNCAFKPCPRGSCPCGSSCTTPQNTNGFCQRNGHCRKKQPVCGPQ